MSTNPPKRALDTLPPDLELASRPPPRPSSASRMQTCAVCGQSYDGRDLMQVDHHGPAPHAPLEG